MLNAGPSIDSGGFVCSEHHEVIHSALQDVYQYKNVDFRRDTVD